MIDAPIQQTLAHRLSVQGVELNLKDLRCAAKVKVAK